MSYKLNLVDKVYKNLTVLERLNKDKDGHYLWLCQCSCGNKSNVRGSLLVSGITKSCGCLRKIKPVKHGKATRIGRHPLYRVWCSMKDRCNNPKASGYLNYGGRGIKVCYQWNSSFESFWQDMSPSYIKGLQLDRIDNNKDYEQSNCRWVTRSKNSKNKRNSQHTQSDYDFVCYKPKQKKWIVTFNTKENAEAAHAFIYGIK